MSQNTLKTVFSDPANLADVYALQDEPADEDSPRGSASAGTGEYIMDVEE
ncbi:hypothetical protein MY10362_007443 [Beauveria mimosiformis]